MTVDPVLKWCRWCGGGADDVRLAGARIDMFRLEQRAQGGLRRGEPELAGVVAAQRARWGNTALPARGEEETRNEHAFLV